MVIWNWDACHASLLWLVHAGEGLRRWLRRRRRLWNSIRAEISTFRVDAADGRGREDGRWEGALMDRGGCLRDNHEDSSFRTVEAWDADEGAVQQFSPKISSVLGEEGGGPGRIMSGHGKGMREQSMGRWMREPGEGGTVLGRNCSIIVSLSPFMGHCSFTTSAPWFSSFHCSTLNLKLFLQHYTFQFLIAEPCICVFLQPTSLNWLSLHWRSVDWGSMIITPPVFNNDTPNL